MAQPRAWWQWTLIAYVIVSGAAASSGMLTEVWTKFVVAINSGVLAWGLIRRPEKGA